MKILFLTQNLSGNSTGRTYALWLAAEHLGWSSRTMSIRGEHVWTPLQNTAFASTCARISADVTNDPRLRAAIDWADIIVIVKPVPSTLGIYSDHPELFSKPVLLDIDDPDLESALAVGRPFTALAKRVLRPRVMRAADRRAMLAQALETMVSNPVLERSYGGTIVPHARVDPGPGRSHESSAPLVAFVGTNNPHKGIGALRAAIDALSSRGYRLTVTDTRPEDAKPWESWVGKTSLDEGVALVKNADIVALPSSARDAFARGQLPAKLMDAMLASRAIVASDLEPIAWALDGTGVLVRPGDVGDLRAALEKLSSPAVRQSLGDSARQRALAMFEVTPVAAAFETSVRRALAREA